MLLFVRACRLALVMILLTASRTSAQGSLTLTSFESVTIPSFGIVTLVGSGFTPATSAISVIVTPRSGLPMTLPVYQATATSVKAVVPPLLSSETGSLFDVPAVASVQVVQVNRSTVMSSNVLSGLTVNPAPAARGAVGSATRAMLKTILDVNADLRYGLASSSARAAQLAAIDAMTVPTTSTIAAVEAVAANRGRVAALPTVNDRPLAISESALRTSDRLVLAYLAQVKAIAGAVPGPTARSAEAVPLGCQCIAYMDDPVADADFCEFRKRPCLAYQVGRKVVPEAAKFVYGTMLSAGLSTHALITGTKKAIDVVDAAWDALRGGVLTYAAAIVTGNDPPPLSEVVKKQGLKLVEDVIVGGSPVTKAAYEALKLGAETEEAIGKAKGLSADAPKGGLLVSAPPPDASPNGQAVKALLADGGASVTVTVQNSASTQTLAAAAVPPTTPARFNGTYLREDHETCSISYDGIGSGAGDMPVSMSTFKVAAGAIDGRITEISSSGSYSSRTVTSQLTCLESGQFWADGLQGGASGSGFCETTVPGGKTSCTQTWTATRLQ